MTDFIVVLQTTEWQRLKALVLDSVSSPITRRVYNLGLDEFIAWYGQEPRPGFTKATVSAWLVALEARSLGSDTRATPLLDVGVARRRVPAVRPPARGRSVVGESLRVPLHVILGRREPRAPASGAARTWALPPRWCGP